MKKIISSIVLIALAGLVLTACGSEAPEPTASAAVTRQPATVIAEGRLMPARWLDQSFSIPGQVAEVLVEDGEEVQPGQPLARLTDSPAASQGLARAEEELLTARQAIDELQELAGTTLAQARLDRIAAQEQFDEAQGQFDADESDDNQTRLDAAAAALERADQILIALESGDGINPARQQAAEARLASAEAAVIAAQALLDSLELKATTAGSVVDLQLLAGEQVAAGQPVITLADLSSWVVETDNLTEIDVVSLEVGQPVQIILDAIPDVTLSGEIAGINTRFEEKRGDITYTATIQLNQTDPRMRWGMTAAIQFGQ